ncbi:MAG: hypothetical protein IH872_05225 [Chloroflexi bacterium]|nr:hypothetical protein [Chloroflexota bacterium]
MPSFLIKIDGASGGGEDIFFSVVRESDVVEFTEKTEPGELPRRLADRLTTRLLSIHLETAITAENSGSLMLIKNVADVAVRSNDDGVEFVESVTGDMTTITSETFGVKIKRFVDRSTVDGPDQRVVRDLGRMIAALSRSSVAESKLAKSAGDAQRTYHHAIRALLTGEPIPPTPNPGGGGEVAIARGAAMGMVADMGAQTPALMNNLAELSDARGEQVGAAERKEKESKGGGGGGGGNGQGEGENTQTDVRQPGSSVLTPPGNSALTPPGGGSAISPPSGAGSIIQPGDASRTDAPGRPQSPPQSMGRPVGDDGELVPYEAPCEIKTYYIDGMEYTAGNFSDGWYLSLGRQDVEIQTEDGGLITVADSHDFGTEDHPDPDLRPFKVDIGQLDALIEQRQSQAAVESDPWADARSFVSLLADFTPVLGQIKGGVEILTGYDFIAGRYLSTEERALSALLTLVPFAGGVLKAGTKATLRAARAAIREGAELTTRHLDALQEGLEAMSRSRLARGRPRAEVRLKSCARPGTRTGSGGLRRSRIRCFAGETLVRKADWSYMKIGDVDVGTVVLSAVGASSQPDSAKLEGRRVSRLFRHRVNDSLSLDLRGPSGETANIHTTQGHYFATDKGYRAAGRLSKGAKILRADGSFAEVTGVASLSGPIEVFNFEVPADHNYFVSPLDILVHNTCICSEGVSQGTAENLLEQEGFPFYHRDGTFGSKNHPDFLPEPVLLDRAPTGQAGRNRLGARVPSGRGTRRPDIYGEVNGVKTTYEIKLPKVDESTLSHFQKNRESILKQANTSWENYPAGNHMLMVDIRNTGQSLDGALGDLTTFIQEGNFRALSEAYGGGVRFIHEAADGTPVLSQVMHWVDL